MPRARDQVFGVPLDTAAAWTDGDPPPVVSHDATGIDPGLVDTGLVPAADPGLVDAGLAALHAAVDDATAASDAVLAEEIARQTRLLQMQAELQTQQVAFQTMSNMMAMQHQTSMAIINNMGGGAPMYEARDVNQNGWIDPGE